MEDLLILSVLLLCASMALYVIGCVSREAHRNMGLTMTTMVMGLLAMLAALQIGGDESLYPMLAAIMVTFMSLARLVGIISQ